HSYIGEEAVAVGVCASLNRDDYITSTHRGHGHCIAKGADLKRMMAELYGKETGYCKGKGGSMHIADFSIGILGANGIVGGGIPIATGTALASQYLEDGRVTVCFFGDGASNQGGFHESLNLASLWKLPVVYVCENNLYAETTPQADHQPIRDVADRAKSYNMPGVIVDGNDVLAVYEKVNKAVERARAGRGPTLVECKTYRYRGHWEGDPEVYRTKEEVKEWKKRDPLKKFKKYLLENDITQSKEISFVEKKIEDEIKDAIKYAQASPLPKPESALEDLYVEHRTGESI
ncbi:thiamine pyrophosphate-dependent dehydrogenase E1 component subunit alpha, partial [Candidatus Aerophobetes bacterium]|nr:thiamine pyrophosphate-dependent dehydrogenase E1 component subunit alpha [Candidatus Aerophobetes bacterium]